MKLTKDLMLGMYEKMLRIRYFENKAIASGKRPLS